MPRSSPHRPEKFVNPSELPWFAIRVKSRCEKMVSEQLRHKGYEEFLPLYKSRRKWSDRIKVVEMPLFSGYLFCRFDVENRSAILATPGVFLIVGQGRTPVAIDSHEVESIRLAIQSGQRIEPYSRLAVGQKVRIDEGSLSGVEGRLLRFKGANHLIISVQLLQRAVAVEVDESWVISSKEDGDSPDGSSLPESARDRSLGTRPNR
jgi:transcription antitermination factor NusG